MTTSHLPGKDPVSCLLDAVVRLGNSCAATLSATEDNWRDVRGKHADVRCSLAPPRGRPFMTLVSEALAFLVQRGADRERAEPLCLQAGQLLRDLFHWHPVSPGWRDADPLRPFDDPDVRRRYREDCNQAAQLMRALSQMSDDIVRVVHSLQFLAASVGIVVMDPEGKCISEPHPAPAPTESACIVHTLPGAGDPVDEVIAALNNKSELRRDYKCRWEEWSNRTQRLQRALYPPTDVPNDWGEQLAAAARHLTGVRGALAEVMPLAELAALEPPHTDALQYLAWRLLGEAEEGERVRLLRALRDDADGRRQVGRVWRHLSLPRLWEWLLPLISRHLPEPANPDRSATEETAAEGAPTAPPTAPEGLASAGPGHQEQHDAPLADPTGTGPVGSVQPQNTNRLRNPVPPCPGCGSPPAASGDVDDLCPRCGEYKFHCGLAEHLPLPQGPDSSAASVWQQMAIPHWERLPPSQVRAPEADRGGQEGGSTPIPREAAAIGSIRLSGASWAVRYGAEQGTYPAKDYSVLAAVAKLVARPNHSFPLVDLVDADTRSLIECPESRDDLLDNPAITDLKRRFEELKRDRENQDDPLVKKENEEELTKIAAELKKSLGPKGRKRKLGSTPTDKAWDALTKNLRRLWPRLRETRMSALADHLERAIQIDRPHITYHPPVDTPPWDTEG